ncbi:hypothetical protein, partial [Capnocytophaga sp. oral taxon 380]|uniref:hypothetical protein n=1 Tax=Capnocytophaga sp. oral taxon 380 TaxID=712217 RepID=UPI001E356B39
NSDKELLFFCCLKLWDCLEGEGRVGGRRTSWRESRRINKAVYCKKKFSLYEPYMNFEQLLYKEYVKS